MGVFLTLGWHVSQTVLLVWAGEVIETLLTVSRWLSPLLCIQGLPQNR